MHTYLQVYTHTWWSWGYLFAVTTLSLACLNVFPVCMYLCMYVCTRIRRIWSAKRNIWFIVVIGIHRHTIYILYIHTNVTETHAYIPASVYTHTWLSWGYLFAVTTLSQSARVRRRVVRQKQPACRSTTLHVLDVLVVGGNVNGMLVMNWFNLDLGATFRWTGQVLRCAEQRSSKALSSSIPGNLSVIVYGHDERVHVIT
jgi:hypothetical protein